jgi:hypothetical protein
MNSITNKVSFQCANKVSKDSMAPRETNRRDSRPCQPKIDNPPSEQKMTLADIPEVLRKQKELEATLKDLLANKAGSDEIDASLLRFKATVYQAREILHQKAKLLEIPKIYQSRRFSRN